MLTDPNDLVIDIFSGSNTTGQVAEAEGRRWLSFEALPEYVAASAFGFLDKNTSVECMKYIHGNILNGTSLDLIEINNKYSLFQES